MEIVMRELSEFPSFVFILVPFFLLIFLPLLYRMKPRFPCRYWKPLGVIYLAWCMWLGHCMGIDSILCKENIFSLTRTSGVLKDFGNMKKNHVEYVLISKDAENPIHLDFMLCGHSELINPYVEKEIAILHKRGIVYQIEMGSEVIYDVERSNQKVWIGNLSHIAWYVLIFCILLVPYFGILNVVNE